MEIWLEKMDGEEWSGEANERRMRGECERKRARFGKEPKNKRGGGFGDRHCCPFTGLGEDVACMQQEND